MGAHGSRAARSNKKPDFASLSAETHFSVEELNALYKRFKGVSNSQVQDNLIDLMEFKHVLSMDNNPFVDRIFAAFDTDDSAEIDFDEFIRGLSALSPKASIEEKAEFCFRVYDLDRNGVIDKKELTEVLRFSLSKNTSIKLTNAQIQTVINSTFRKMDVNGDGDLSLQEFQLAAKKNPAILSCVNISMDAIVQE